VQLVVDNSSILCFCLRTVIPLKLKPINYDACDGLVLSLMLP
jgi:hypothetical protein